MSDRPGPRDEQLDQLTNSSAGPATAIDFSGPGHVDPEELPLYAMQFLSGERTSAIAGHLRLCAVCSAELAQIQGDLAAYAFTTELESPTPAARQRFLAQVAQEKRVVPVPQPVPQAPEEDSAQPALAAFGRGNSLLDPVEVERPKRSIGLAIFGGIGWAIAAGLALVAFTLHKDSAFMRGNLQARASEIQRLTVEAASSHQLMDALTDPKAVRVALTASPQPKPVPIGGVTYNPDKGTLVFLASNLDPLQMYKTYELWVIPADGSAPIPAGTFHPDDQGNASVIMPDLPKGIAAKAFGVTVEDDGGAQTPTLPIVMAGAIG
ncbi:MAG: anti-sigma factor [Acidobacteriaceae bacterium]|jgi:hypothetical protein